MMQAGRTPTSPPTTQATTSPPSGCASSAVRSPSASVTAVPAQSAWRTRAATSRSTRRLNALQVIVGGAGVAQLEAEHRPEAAHLSGRAGVVRILGQARVAHPHNYGVRRQLAGQLAGGLLGLTEPHR